MDRAGCATLQAAGGREFAEHMTPVAIDLPIPRDIDADLIDRPAGRGLGIVDRALPGVARKAHGELAGWVDRAEQHIGDGIASLAAAEPSMEDGGGVAILPFQRQGST